MLLPITTAEFPFSRLSTVPETVTFPPGVSVWDATTKARDGFSVMVEEPKVRRAAGRRVVLSPGTGVGVGIGVGVWARGGGTRMVVVWMS